jgi:RimJ/RimL family protein N-acetyltransferase
MKGGDMIEGNQIRLRPIGDEDWLRFEEWGSSREALWGLFQRFQLDHVPLLREAYQQTGLLKRDSGILLVETIGDRQVVGFVRYTMLSLPDADLPHPEIGFGIPEVAARGKGHAKEGVRLLVEYLFAGYPVERVAAFTDEENRPAQRVLERVGFQREGVLRRATFRDGQWRDIAVYGILRHESGVKTPGQKRIIHAPIEERRTQK